MPDNKGNGEGGEGPPKPPDNVHRLTIKPKTQDQKTAEGEDNRAAIYRAGIAHRRNIAEAPARQRVRHLLIQHTEIYNQIKEAKKTPQILLWIEDPPESETTITPLVEHFRTLPEEEKNVARKEVREWLDEKFGHETPLQPQVFRVVAGHTRDGETIGFAIQWAEPSILNPFDGDDDPSSTG